MSGRGVISNLGIEALAEAKIISLFGPEGRWRPTSLDPKSTVEAPGVSCVPVTELSSLLILSPSTVTFTSKGEGSTSGSSGKVDEKSIGSIYFGLWIGMKISFDTIYLWWQPTFQKMSCLMSICSDCAGSNVSIHSMVLASYLPCTACHCGHTHTDTFITSSETIMLSFLAQEWECF